MTCDGVPRLLCRKTRYVNIAAISHILFHVCRQIRANARPRNRHSDESPDGDWALPWPRRASASPGVASATPPTLRVSSPRRSRMPPSRHTNFHEWNHKTHCFPESAAHLVVDFIDHSANCAAFIWYINPLLILATIIATSCPKFVQHRGRIRVPRRRHSCRGHPTRTEGLEGAETHGEGRCHQSSSSLQIYRQFDLQDNAAMRLLKRRNRASDAPRFVVARQRMHLYANICMMMNRSRQFAVFCINRSV